ncbi:MAG: type II secretion system F family protein [Deltaproteobacteria bacterium]|nr:type II secretion system F family protein [Deltaproteobacteria bacterium]
MTPYSYRATTREGRIVEGSVEASGEAAVVASLRSQGLIPLTVRAGAAEAAAGSRLSFSFTAPWKRPRKVKGRDLMLFTGELATLLKAGMPLDRSLASLSSLTENATLEGIVREVLGRVQEGRSLSQALGEYPKVFPPIYVNMIRAGEAGGVVETVLERLAEYLERTEKTRDEIKSAMVYPLVLSLTAAAAITIMLTVVLPRFASIFADLGAAMPTSTRLVMGASDFIKSYWWVVLILGFGAYSGVRRWLDTAAGRQRFDRFSLSAPIFGDLTRKLQVSRFARTLGTMLKSGVPLIQALEIVRTVVANVVISQALAGVQRDVSEGKGLSGPLEKSGVFPSLALQMVGVGEETGRLDDMLLVVSEHYDREVSNAVARVMSLMGPMVLVVMGLVVGFIVWAMMSAVFSVNQMVV